MMNRVYVSVGSNSSDCRRQMMEALKWVSGSLLKQPRVSTVYSTPAVNGRDNDYLNCVAAGLTDRDLEPFIGLLKEYEVSKGRTDASKMRSVVPIDLDAVIWNEDVLRPRDYGREYFLRGYRELLNESENGSERSDR